MSLLRSWSLSDPLLYWSGHVLLQMSLVAGLVLLLARFRQSNPPLRHAIFCFGSFLLLTIPPLAIGLHRWQVGFLSIGFNPSLPEPTPRPNLRPRESGRSNGSPDWRGGNAGRRSTFCSSSAGRKNRLGLCRCRRRT